MTREEAIEILWQYDVNFEPHPAEKVMHAIDMAIEALSADSVHKPDYSYEAGMVKRLKEAQSADAVTTVIRAKTFMRKEDFDKWAEDIKKQNKSIVCIPCDAEVVSAEAEWIPCSERLPRDLLRVNVTWINHNPPVYYQHIKDIPQTDTAVRYNGNWYWWDSTLIDVLAEYGEESGAEQIDKDIEVVAWTPLPKPYREDGEE